MANRTEFCTPEERRFLDLMHSLKIESVEAGRLSASIKFSAVELVEGEVGGHDLVSALYNAYNDTY